MPQDYSGLPDATGASAPEHDDISHAGSAEVDMTARLRPRTFPYFKHLPYQAEPESEALANLQVCLEHLYVAVAAGDFYPGVVHWTREIRGWSSLKFDMPRDIRVKLVQLYYGLSLAPGLENSMSERFASMFMSLTKCVPRRPACVPC
jgi:proteasome activator subunit 4